MSQKLKNEFEKEKIVELTKGKNKSNTFTGNENKKWKERKKEKIKNTFRANEDLKKMQNERKKDRKHTHFYSKGKTRKKITKRKAKIPFHVQQVLHATTLKFH